MSIQLTSIVGFRKLRRVEFVLVCAVFIALIGLSTAQAHADVTFGATVTNANESLSTTLTWAAPGASGCVAGGHPSWSGSKAASGSEKLPTISMSGTYPLTLTCSFPGDRKATIRWIPPTQNTDGSTLTNLAGYTVYYGLAADALSQTAAVNGAGVTSFVLEDLAPGTWFFAVRSRNSLNVESAISNIATKTITADADQTASVSLTVNPVPNPVGPVEVE